MTENNEKISPDKLLQGFSKSRIIPCLAAAFVIHLVVIGITSLGYIRYWITGEEPPPVEQKAPETPKPAPVPAAAPVQQTAVRPPAASAQTGGSLSEAEIMEQRKDTSVVKRITEVAKPEEIPQTPDNLGISLEETNKF